MKSRPDNIISIPMIDNFVMYERNRRKAESQDLEFCPCCGKSITNPKFAINSIYGGMTYPANDTNQYADAWVMLVGSECKKKFPKGYVYELPKDK